MTTGLLASLLQILAAAAPVASTAAPAGANGAAVPAVAGVPGAVRGDQKSGLEFVFLPGGSFNLGCVDGDAQCKPDEKPPKPMTVQAFWIGKTAVTVVAYSKCVAAGVCKASKEITGGYCNVSGANAQLNPINCVSRPSSEAFCKWIGGRLPTAAEREFAAKSGESRIYPWGNEPPSAKRAFYGAKNGSTMVGTHQEGASKWGLQDMAGNVWEWTSDTYDKTFKEVRGGAWSGSPPHLRASNRGQAEDWWTTDNIGFRCVQ